MLGSVSCRRGPRRSPTWHSAFDRAAPRRDRPRPLPVSGVGESVAPALARGSVGRGRGSLQHPQPGDGGRRGIKTWPWFEQRAPEERRPRPLPGFRVVVADHPAPPRQVERPRGQTQVVEIEQHERLVGAHDDVDRREVPVRDTDGPRRAAAPRVAEVIDRQIDGPARVRGSTSPPTSSSQPAPAAVTLVRSDHVSSSPSPSGSMRINERARAPMPVASPSSVIGSPSA